MNRRIIDSLMIKKVKLLISEKSWEKSRIIVVSASSGRLSEPVEVERTISEPCLRSILLSLSLLLSSHLFLPSQLLFLAFLYLFFEVSHNFFDLLH